jgi:ABC-type sulfate transport system substrate-binding protein
MFAKNREEEWTKRLFNRTKLVLTGILAINQTFVFKKTTKNLITYENDLNNCLIG